MAARELKRLDSKMARTSKRDCEIEEMAETDPRFAKKKVPVKVSLRGKPKKDNKNKGEKVEIGEEDKEA